METQYESKNWLALLRDKHRQVFASNLRSRVSRSPIPVRTCDVHDAEPASNTNESVHLYEQSLHHISVLGMSP